VRFVLKLEVGMSDYAHPESLASTQWVADHLADPAIRFVEVVWGDSFDRHAGRVVL
jgi:hypothetical protein